MIPCDVTACRERLYKECAWITERVNVDRRISPLECESRLGVLSAARASKPLDAERYSIVLLIDWNDFEVSSSKRVRKPVS
ncbi:hypothetical protein AVEN_215447-1 [Araneus ventricosus]|uniref:Uncharacterized protein n=1 Tax=Araneus ventricosus TaxID=182803 RepID=A0A4Y1ZK89_ARAVE|nr:hypothetical protein AVEN_67465-1 [Araneus ventricosus]GBL54435.1 hypothetical protein AVEN_159166-1 [Araneus ventricosus]GBL54458.1 hypothetical protein AVEN_176823-1 [Araneus ventricosus]GBL54478.1 hypothetical protein AVEN_215447-1 [Araneus ventricosus]